MKVGDRAKVIPNRWTAKDLIGVEVEILEINTSVELAGGNPVAIRYISDFEGIEGVIPSTALEVIRK